jgi:uncharacterized protein involved in outer membrane biogenesis
LKKAALAVLAVVVLLLITAPLALWILLDPESLKARAVTYVKGTTGRDLAITGPVTLSFFPWLGGVIKTASLAAPPGFGDEPFASIDELDLKVRALPLFGGDIVIDTVRAKGVRLRLKRRRDGRTNWDGLITAAAAQPSAVSRPQPPRILQVAGLELKDSEAIWSDEAGGRYELKGIELTTGAFGGGEPSDLDLSFTFTGFGGAPVPVKVTSRVMLDAGRSRIMMDEVEATVSQSKIKGRLLSEPGKGRDALRTWRGDLAIDRVQAYGVRASDVKTPVELTGGIATIGPATGRFYGGQYTGTVHIDARGPEPIVQFDQRLTGVDVGPLLDDLQVLGGVKGQGELLTLKAKMRGTSLRTLGGNASLSIRDGQLVGANVLRMIEQARAMAAQVRRGAQSGVDQGASTTDVTPFATLTGSATIAGGIARNTDLVLTSSTLNATGSGAADLERATLDYMLRARTPETGDVTIPIVIAGPFSSLRYRVDAGAMIRDAASQEIKRQIKKGLESLFKRKP